MEVDDVGPIVIRLLRTDEGFVVDDPAKRQALEGDLGGPVGARRGGALSDPRGPTILNASRGSLEGLDAFPYSSSLLSKVKPARAEYPVVIPGYSTWFNLDEIHANEIRALPEFFGPTKSVETERYKRYRNFIVGAYRANPRVYLSATAARKLLAADACAVLRIHNFLESWGLINYLVDPGTLPLMSGTPQGAESLASLYAHSAYSGLRHLGGGVHNAGDGPSGAQADLLEFDETAENQFVLRKSMITGASVRGYAVPVTPIKCSSCHDDASTPFYLFRQFQAEHRGVCEQCFHQGKYPSVYSSADFVRADSLPTAVDRDNDGWTEGENARLLEAVARYEEDWEEVSRHVGRSKEECVEHFVQLPLLDEYLEQSHNFLGTSIGPGGSALDLPSVRSATPFADADNPVQAQVAFLTSMISPAVGAAAAKSAMDNLVKKMGEGGGAEPMEVVPDGEESKEPLRLEEIQEIAAQAFGAAAVKAKELAGREEKQIMAAVLELVTIQMKKTEVKMKHLETMELLMTREKEHLDKCRHRLFNERVQLAQARVNLQSQMQQVAQQLQQFNEAQDGAVAGATSSDN